MRWASFFVVRVRMSGGVAQRHDGVDGTEQDQRERERDVEKEPAVEPVVQALLAEKLAGFVADVLQVVEGGVCGDREQSAETSEGVAGFDGVGQARAAELWRFEE